MAALIAMLAIARHMLTAMIPIASTRCFITASMIDSTATAPSAATKALDRMLDDAVHAPQLAA